MSDKLRVLVIGGGGREHALAWRLRRSPSVQQVFCMPGNAGIGREACCIDASIRDHAGIVQHARTRRIDLVVVGPEAPLSEGLADRLVSAGIPTLGPSQAAARLESSKVFAKEFMVRHGIPTARFSVHETAQDALAAVKTAEYPLVIKADGLAAGKGVVIARSAEEAKGTIRRIMVEREFGEAGNRVLLEQFLTGPEASYIVFTDGKTILPAVPARDHKAAYDNDQGPNTGGMGAYSCADILGDALEKEIQETVIRPVVRGMEEEGTPFQGILYAGLMLTAGGPSVLEFNVRMGDPEAQAILPRLDSDFGLLCLSASRGCLHEYQAVWKPDAAVCVVLASGGYPGAYAKGKVVTGIERAEEFPQVVVFQAGTRTDGRQLVTDGGRVLGVTAVAPGLPAAAAAAYEAVDRIHFEGMHYRKDIGAPRSQGGSN